MWFTVTASKMLNSAEMHTMAEFEVRVWAKNRGEAMHKVRREFGQIWHLRVN